MSHPSVSIVIRCHNEAEHISAVLDAVEEQSFADFEIVVVDSGSTDGTLELVEKYDVRLVHIDKERFSFGRSLNLGCRAARGGLLVFLSAHCYPMSRDWLTRLVDGFSDDEVAAVYGMQRAVESSAYSEHRILRRWFPETSVPRQEAPFLNNANCAVRRSVWEQYPYDEELPGLEDVAWAKDVLAAGWLLSYRADAGVYHVHRESTTQTRHRYQREAITFQRVFPAEHFNLVDFLRLTSMNVSADWRAAHEEGVLGKNWASIVRFRVAQFWGTYQGFHTRWPSSSQLKRRFYYPEE